MKKPTMTTHDVCELFRNCDIQIDEVTLQEGLKQGVFPFGIAIKRDRWVFIIYSKRVMDYLRSLDVEVDDGQAV